jgi:hypothetical protein
MRPLASRAPAFLVIGAPEFEFVDQFSFAIARRVVHDDQFTLIRRQSLLNERLEDVAEQHLTIERGDNDGNDDIA